MLRYSKLTITHQRNTDADAGIRPHSLTYTHTLADTQNVLAHVWLISNDLQQHVFSMPVAEFQSIPLSSKWHFTYICIYHVLCSMLHKLLLGSVSSQTVQYKQGAGMKCAVLRQQTCWRAFRETHSDVYQDRVMEHSGNAELIHTLMSSYGGSHKMLLCDY